MEREIFGFGSAASGLQKERHLNYIILSLFSSSLAAARRAPVTAFSGNSNIRSHFAITSHRHARIRSRRLLGACFVFALWLRFKLAGNHKRKK